MSWFGETFGDSLNSLKGQITKITKEVLADEETGSQEAESTSSVVKELEALCESKDLEIASLREEFNIIHNKYKKEIEVLKRGNESNGLECVSGLEKELEDLRRERDHLNSCLDELQAEHQINLNEAISIKDKYRTELEGLKREYESVCSKLESAEESLKEKVQHCNQNEGNDVELKKEITKLLTDVEAINRTNLKTEEENKKLKIDNEDLRNKMMERERNCQELEIQIKMLINEKNELLRKQKEFSESKLEVVEVQSKVKDLFKVFYEEDSSEDNIFKLLSVIESECKALQVKEEGSKKLKETVSSLESEVKSLKTENSNVQRDFKLSRENWVETEKKYQEEISGLKNIISEMKTCMNESQTDDMKRLEQEVAQLLLTKNNEVEEYSRSITSLKEECISLKTRLSNVEQELSENIKEKSILEKEIEVLKGSENDKLSLQEEQKVLEANNAKLGNENGELKTKILELENQISGLILKSQKVEELEKVQASKTELENAYAQVQKINLSMKNDLENLKAQVIVKDSNLGDLMKCNKAFQDEINQLQTRNNELQSIEKEIKKWKDVSVDLEIQNQDLIAKKEEIESECLRLRSELELSAVKDAEILQLKQANASLVESCNQLHRELETKVQFMSETTELEAKHKKQTEALTELQEENNELKSRVQKFQEQMLQMVQGQKEEVQQHRRSKSDIDYEKPSEVSEEVMLLKQTLQQEQARYRLLQNQHQEVLEKEANARKEFERLKQHLLEIEDHYTEESIASSKTIDDLKSKLVAAEEQLQNSSTLYTSMKVRDNQHLESLQAQIRLMSTQRDDFQAKLSAAEDEVQKHKASLMSLQIVLEQFQQDKEREVEAVAMKYEQQLQLTHNRFRELEAEIEGLKKQLSEAKNGLKAASRLGEQLEKKGQQVSELEGSITVLKEKVTELEGSLAVANQSNNGKIDKSLIKNLVVGYVLSPNGDRKAQVLRIMASVLEFDAEERNKMGVDSTSSGWLSNILHPKSGGPPSSQSLSEAFIKFLESESRPQPQVKFHPEQFQASMPKPTSSSPKPPGRISELMLPTFSSSQDNESSVILKSVLKDS